ncbi:MAG: hypothetical protein JSS71_12105 [Armatimonadetes bacterium]|nr:hypothetical protein [Armatimonadota bacterium]MBX3109233.1 hypothetical protein [Fimbriimonadaceae bacterium]
MTLALVPLLLGQAPTFEQLEQMKQDAINKLTGFKGTYVMVSIPQEGAGMRQEVTLTISPDGRRTKLYTEGLDVAESAYNKKRKWTAYLLDKAYEMDEPEGGIELPPNAPKLTPAAGEMSLTLDDLGPRFATNPSPTVTAATEDTVDGKKLTRYDAKTISPTQKSQVQITQWFEPKTFVLRQFEITKTTEGRVSRIKGYLIKDSINTKVDPSEYDLPAAYSGFKRIKPR